MKKKMILLGLIIVMMVCIMPVHATDIQGACTQISTSIDIKLPKMIHSIITIIQIAVPIVLVIFGMLDLFKGIYAQKEEEIKKGQQTFVKRLIAAAIVFFVIVIVKLLIGFVADETDEKEESIMTCANCFINGVNDDGTCK